MKRMWSKNELNRIIALLLASGQLNEVDSKDFKINGEKAIQTWNGSVTNPEGITKTGEYCKVVRNFNELQFICNCRLTNTTENTITYSNDGLLAYFGVLPNEILDKIYNHAGVKLTEATENSSIAYATLFLSSTGGTVNAQNPKYVNLFFVANDKVLEFFIEGGSIEIAANGSIDIEARISLAL